jgi:hypothetical protein
VERRTQRLSRGHSVGYPIHRPHQSRVQAVGGTSRHSCWVTSARWPCSRQLPPPQRDTDAHRPSHEGGRRRPPGCTASGTATSRAARRSRPTDDLSRRPRWWRWPCDWPTTPGSRWPVDPATPQHGP